MFLIICIFCFITGSVHATNSQLDAQIEMLKQSIQMTKTNAMSDVYISEECISNWSHLLNTSDSSALLLLVQCKKKYNFLVI